MPSALGDSLEHYYCFGVAGMYVHRSIRQIIAHKETVFFVSKHLWSAMKCYCSIVLEHPPFPVACLRKAAAGGYSQSYESTHTVFTG